MNKNNNIINKLKVNNELTKNFNRYSFSKRYEFIFIKTNLFFRRSVKRNSKIIKFVTPIPN